MATDMPKLLTETNTLAVQRKIRSAARAKFHRRYIDAFFEHGQWWITVCATGAQYSVCDSSDPCGFDFEQITEGDEQC